MKSAEDWDIAYSKDQNEHILDGKPRTLAWRDGSLCRAIQIDALQHALNLVQYSDPVATVNAIGAEIQKLREKESGR